MLKTSLRLQKPDFELFLDELLKRFYVEDPELKTLSLSRFVLEQHTMITGFSEQTMVQKYLELDLKD